MDYLILHETWQVIFTKLKSYKNIYIKSEIKFRLFIESVYFILRSGCQWRLLPKVYGNWNTNYKRFKRWSDRGIWLWLFTILKLKTNHEIVMIDSTVVKAHACSSGFKDCLGRSVGGLSTKIHAIVDDDGKPIKFILTGGQKSDIDQAIDLTKEQENNIVIADKAYDCDKLINNLRSKNCTVVIPLRKSRKLSREFDKDIYKLRNVIERFFSKIKHFGRIFSRFDKTSNVFSSFLYIVCLFVWNVNEP
jgi:transposase